ncbi:MAG TPA: hypothetical protein VJ225_02930 [Nitrososphaeraceae archaeon]|nr:hypothetical protein [Nitrososphaeraceae archaeon]
MTINYNKVKAITGLGNKNRLTPEQKKMQKLRESIEKEKDLDIKQKLKKGNIVTIIEDVLDY